VRRADRMRSARCASGNTTIRPTHQFLLHGKNATNADVVKCLIHWHASTLSTVRSGISDTHE
jgi:hypothetical protein